jgi:predicted secreted hydrolase
MFTVTGKAEEMFKLISRWSSSFAIAVTLVLGTLSSTAARAVDLNLCRPPASSAWILLPEDDAPHDVADEWYYTTGHLRTPSGKRYGFETVVFKVKGQSGFVTIGQVAVTDLNDRTFHFETLGPVPGPFPTSTDGFNVEVTGGVSMSMLSMSGDNGSYHITGSLTDDDGSYRIDLILYAVKNPVYQADDGLIQYADPPSSTQYYYSRPRMAAFGSVTAPDGTTEVAFGQSWFDHEYGTLPQEINWEWFSIQLDDGREIMAYNIRDAKTQTSYAKFGSIQDPPPGCRVQSLGELDFDMSFENEITGRQTGITYWNTFGLSVPSRHISLTLKAELDDQEVFTPDKGLPPYWEGSVKVSGTVHRKPVSGVGYVELVEYQAP